MTEDHLYDGSCEIVSALNLLSGRWKLPILWKLSFGALRYNALKRQVRGITNIMLTRSLRELEAHGLVSRVQYPEVPPCVEYALTKSGEKLIPALRELKKWGEEQAVLEKELKKDDRKCKKNSHQ